MDGRTGASWSQAERRMWHEVKGKPIVFRFTVSQLPASAAFVNAGAAPSFIDVDRLRLVLGAGEEIRPNLRGRDHVGLGAGVKLLTPDDQRPKGKLF
jgi:hypothetical protein